MNLQKWLLKRAKHLEYALVIYTNPTKRQLMDARNMRRNAKPPLKHEKQRRKQQIALYK